MYVLFPNFIDTATWIYGILLYYIWRYFVMCYYKHVTLLLCFLDNNSAK
jgi:hypothetical protein